MLLLRLKQSVMLSAIFGMLQIYIVSYVNNFMKASSMSQTTSAKQVP